MLGKLKSVRNIRKKKPVANLQWWFNEWTLRKTGNYTVWIGW